MTPILDLFVLHTWWSYAPHDYSAFAGLYHWFNVLEGVVWCVFSLLVFVRHSKFRKAACEVVYAAAFFTFGLTDFCEAYRLTSWLLWAKLGNLILLLWLRASIMKRYYPQSKVY